jgi:predicted nucleotidyltransferase
MMPAATNAEVKRRLAKVEEDEGVRIVIAIESGSRAWGFASPDSDFDVRFIYCRRESWYFSLDIEEKRDVLEYGITDEIDLNGWDLRKALRLLVRCNPTVVEWLQSPIEYLVRGRFRSAARELLARSYVPASGIHHYRSMAKTNYRGYLRAESVPLKKYFYVLRPLLAIRWIEQYKSPPPIELQELLSGLHERSDLLEDISALLERKKISAEMDVSAPLPRLNQYIESELDRLEGFSKDCTVNPNHLEAANVLFRSLVRETWEPNSALLNADVRPRMETDGSS